MDEITIRTKTGIDFLIDEEDKEKLEGYSWHLQKPGNYMSGAKYKGQYKSEHVYLHRIITGAKKGEHVDHINGNKLDNRKSNLRICTQKENNRNTGPRRNKQIPKYKGVYKSRSAIKPYRSQIYSDGIFTHIGLFETAEEAAEAYNEVAKELYGEYAYINKTQEQYAEEETRNT